MFLFVVVVVFAYKNMGVFVLSLGFVFNGIVQLIQIAAPMYETWRRREERVLHPSIGHFTPIPLYKHEYPIKGSKKHPKSMTPS